MTKPKKAESPGPKEKALDDAQPEKNKGGKNSSKVELEIEKDISEISGDSDSKEKGSDPEEQCRPHDFRVGEKKEIFFGKIATNRDDEMKKMTSTKGSELQISQEREEEERKEKEEKKLFEKENEQKALNENEKTEEEIENEKDWLGHSMEREAEEGTSRMIWMNLRRFKKAEADRLETEMFQQFQVWNVQVAHFSDHGLEKGTSGHSHQARVQKRAANFWGGNRMLWRMREGMRGKRGKQLIGQAEGGAGIAVNTESRLEGKDFEDPKGWGRWFGRTMLGPREGGKGMLTISVSGPAKVQGNGGTWGNQKRELNLMQPGEAEPDKQFVKDLIAEVQKLKKKQKRQWTIVIGGDFNMKWDPSSSNEKEGNLKHLAEVLGLENVMEKKHGKTFATFINQKSRTTIDHVLITKGMTKQLVKKVAVLQGRRLNNSDHRLIAVDIDMALAIGTRQVKRPQRTNDPKLNATTQPKKVREFQETLCELWRRERLTKKRWELQHLAREAEEDRNSSIPVSELTGFNISQSVVSPNRTVPLRNGRNSRVSHRQGIQEKMDETMDAMIETIVKAQSEVMKTKEGGSGSSLRVMEKNRRSYPSRRKALELARLQKIVSRQEGDTSRLMRMREMVARHEKIYGRLHDEQEVKQEASLMEIRDKVQRRIKKVKKELREEEEKSKSKSIESMGKERKKDIENSNWGKIYKRIKSQTFTPQDKRVLLVGSEENQRVVTDPDEIANLLDDHFSDWFGASTPRWFQGFDDKGDRTHTHKLWAMTTEGREFRKELVECGDQAWPDESRNKDISAERMKEFEKKFEESTKDMPERCKSMLMMYGRKFSSKMNRKVKESDYKAAGVMQEISGEDWEKYWTKVKAHKAADGHGMHVDLIKAIKAKVLNGKEGEESAKECLTGQVFEDLRHMINVCIKTGMVYDNWKLEVLCTIEKVPGSAALCDVRPIGLLAILRNGMMGIQAQKITAFWKKTKLLSEKAYGFVPGRQIDELRLVINTVLEQAYLQKRPIASATLDQSKCFDSYLQGCFELASRRLALPEEWIDLDAALNEQAVTKVRFAYGLTPGFKRGRKLNSITGMLEGTSQGAAQGGTDSASPKFVAVQDMINTLWEKLRTGFPVQVSARQGIILSGGAFADDQKLLVESTREATEWMQYQGDNAILNGITNRKEKCAGSAIEYDENGERKEIENIAPIELLMGDEARPEPIPMVHPEDSIKFLGEKSSLALYWSDAVKDAKKKADEVLGYFDTFLHPREAEAVWKALLTTSIVYKLKLATVSTSELQEVVQKVFTRLKNRVKLAMGTPTKLIHALGIGDIEADLNVERLVMLLKMLNSKYSDTKAAATAMVNEHQRWYGGATPVLEQDNKQGKQYSGTIIERTHHFMSEMNIKITGGDHLVQQPRRENDKRILDAASEVDRDKVRHVCWLLDLYFYSQIEEEETGEIQQEFRKGGPVWKRIGKETNDAERDAWQCTIQKIAESRPQMGTYTPHAIEVGTSVRWKDQNQRKWQAGRVLHVSEEQGWGAEITIGVWKPDVSQNNEKSRWGLNRTERCGPHDFRVEEKKEEKRDEKAMRQDVDEDQEEEREEMKAKEQRSRSFWSGSSGESSEEESHEQATNTASNLAVNVTEQGESRDTWIASQECQWDSWMKGKLQDLVITKTKDQVQVIEVMETLADGDEGSMKMTQKQSEEKIKEMNVKTKDQKQKTEKQRIKYQGFEEIAGIEGTMDEAKKAWEDIRSEAQLLEKLGEEPILLTYSDGSVKPAKGATESTFGWCILGLKGGQRGQMIKGKGRMKGDPRQMTSTRAERMGIVATLNAMFILGEEDAEEGELTRAWSWNHEHRLDNASSVTVEESAAERYDEEWHMSIQASHTSDGNAEEEAKTRARESTSDAKTDQDACAEMIGMRNYSSPRMQTIWHRGHPEKRLKEREYTEHDHMSVLVDQLAGEAYSIEETEEESWHFSHRQQWQIECGGTLVTGNVRKFIQEHVKTQRFAQYCVTKKSNSLEKQHAKEKPYKKDQDGKSRNTEGNTKAEVAVKAKEQARQDHADWVDEESMKDMKKSGEISERVRYIKLVSKNIHTKAQGWRQKQSEEEGDGPECRICGKHMEDNEHVMWTCTGSETLVQARRQLQQAVTAELQAVGMKKDRIKEVTSPWHMQAMGKMDDEAQASVGDTAKQLSEAAKQGTGGQHWFRCGLMGRVWNETLQREGLSAKVARKADADIREKLRRKALDLVVVAVEELTKAGANNQKEKANAERTAEMVEWTQTAKEEWSEEKQKIISKNTVAKIRKTTKHDCDAGIKKANQVLAQLRIKGNRTKMRKAFEETKPETLKIITHSWQEYRNKMKCMDSMLGQAKALGKGRRTRAAAQQTQVTIDEKEMGTEQLQKVEVTKPDQTGAKTAFERMMNKDERERQGMPGGQSNAHKIHSHKDKKDDVIAQAKLFARKLKSTPPAIKGKKAICKRKHNSMRRKQLLSSSDEEVAEQQNTRRNKKVRIITTSDEDESGNSTRDRSEGEDSSDSEDDRARQKGRQKN